MFSQFDYLAYFSFLANPNAGPYDGIPPVTTGTANPTYSVFQEKDPANANATLQYQSITCMPQYRGSSFEVDIYLLILLFIHGLIFPRFRNYAYKIISRIERLPAPLVSVNQHSPAQPNLPPLPIYSDRLLSRSLRTLCLVHSIMQVQILQPREVPLADWAKLQHKQPGALVVSTSLPSSLASSLPLAALGPSTSLNSLNSLRILVYSGAVMHLHPKINHWAGLVRLLISVLIVDLPYHRRYWGLWKWC
jgi:hypothetical protein